MPRRYIPATRLRRSRMRNRSWEFRPGIASRRRCPIRRPGRQAPERRLELAGTRPQPGNKPIDTDENGARTPTRPGRFRDAAALAWDVRRRFYATDHKEEGGSQHGGNDLLFLASRPEHRAEGRRSSGGHYQGGVSAHDQEEVIVMADNLRRGFKAEAERFAFSLRAELGLKVTDPLDSVALAAHLEIPVVSLEELRRDGANNQSNSRLMSRTSGFSALTICEGTRKLIVYNPRHPPTRR